MQFFGGLEIYHCTNFYSIGDVSDFNTGINAASKRGWVSTGYYISNSTGISFTEALNIVLQNQPKGVILSDSLMFYEIIIFPKEDNYFLRLYYNRIL